MNERVAGMAKDDSGWAFLSVGGTSAAEIRSHDWSASAVGSPEDWPDLLRSTLATMLSSPQPMFVAWGDDLLFFFNDAYRPLLGEKVHGAVGRPFAELWSDIWEDIEPIVLKTLGGEGVRFEDMPLTMMRNGYLEETWWSFSYMPLRDGNGLVRGMLCVTADATAKMIAERLSRSERERLRQMFDQAPSFMAMLAGPEHRVELANPSYMRLIGHREVLGRTLAEALPDAVEQGYVEVLDGVFRTGEAVTSNGARYAMQAEPGGPVDERFVDLVFQPILDEEGAVNGIFVEGSDVTVRVAAEAELREALGFNELILQSSRDCIVVMDLEGHTLFVSPGGIEAMEISDVGAIIGLSWLRVWQGEDGVAARQAVADARAGGTGRFQGFCPTHKGRPRWWDVVISPLPGADGLPERLVSVGRDITEQRLAENQRQDLMREMSHRMKNMLSMVQAITTQTFRQMSSIEEGRVAITGRVAALARAQDILVHSADAPSDILKIVDGALSPHQTTDLRIEIAGPKVELSAQQGLGLSLALHELATNAAKYGALSNEDGRVRIGWSLKPGGEFLFEWIESGGP